MKSLVSGLIFFCFISAQAQDSLSFDPETMFPLADKAELFGLTEAEKSPYRLDQTFYFNKKIFFTAKTSEIQLQSYFYMNTKNGTTGYDIDVAKQLGKEYSTMDFSIRLDDGNTFMYQFHPKTNEKIASIIREGPGFLPKYLEDANAVEFFKDYFERTEEKTLVGDKSQFASVLYQGVDMEGGSMFALMSDNSGFNMNPDNKLLILSIFGLGYIYFEGKTKLLSGWESDDYVARIERIEDANFTFDGKPYKTYQQKADAEINKFEVAIKTDFEKEKEKLDHQERALETRISSQSTPGNPQRDAVEREIIQVKKQLTDKKEQLNSKAASGASEISKKQGDLGTMNMEIYETMGGNDMLEILILEARLDKLNSEKKLLTPGIKEKDAQEATRKLNCAKQRLTLINQTLDEFVAIDNKFPENAQQRFIHKMNMMNTQLMPSLQTVCN